MKHYHWLENIKNNVVRISTPYSTGNGIVMPQWNLIITNEHIVRDCRQVLVEGIQLKREKYDILFLDEKNDIALISFSKEAEKVVNFVNLCCKDTITQKPNATYIFTNTCVILTHLNFNSLKYVK